MEEKLLPCPFCGRPAELVGADLIETRCEAWCIMHGERHTLADWNCRIPPPATKEILDEFRDAITEGYQSIPVVREEMKDILAEWPERGAES